jgi:hypothetical protein
LARAQSVQERFVTEPGLDMHEWETAWQDLEPLLADSPAEALPEMERLVEEMLQARGFPVDEDDVAAEGEEREVTAEFVEARRIARLVDAGESVAPGDVGAAVEGFRSVYAFLVESRRAP